VTLETENNTLRIPEGYLLVPKDVINKINDLVFWAGMELECTNSPWDLIHELYTYEWPWQIEERGGW